MRNLLASLTLTSALLGGCYTTASVGYRPYVRPAPRLVYLGPGVQVLAEDDGVYYADGYYWRYDGGGWYRSVDHRGGWVVWGDVPVAVRGAPRARLPVAAEGGVVVRDAYRPVRTGAAGPAVTVTGLGRDHRTTIAPGVAPRVRPAPSREHRRR